MDDNIKIHRDSPLLLQDNAKAHIAEQNISSYIICRLKLFNTFRIHLT